MDSNGEFWEYITALYQVPLLHKIVSFSNKCIFALYHGSTLNPKVDTQLFATKC